MVVFTCQHCNASLKRVAVAKHYSTKCRKTPYLTCIDCLKDFRGDDYDSHMTCVTEDERYGDKNFVAKPVGTKQTEWIDVVHMCAKRNENPKFKLIFSKLASYQNVPRKKPKFLNFIKSSLPRFSQDIAVEVFQIIDDEFLKQKKTDSQNEISSKSVNNADEPSGNEEVTGKNAEKKKKKKRSHNSESEVLPAEGTDKNVTAKEDSRKKKKLKNTSLIKSQVLENGDMANLFNIKVKNKKDKEKNGFLNKDSEKSNHEEPNETGNNEKMSKKEMKKLKKKQKYEAELKNIEESEPAKDKELENGENDLVSEVTSKKKKKRKATVCEIEPDTRKRQKVEGGDESENCAVENEANEEEEKPHKAKVTFNWEEMIKEVLRKSSDHEMSLKRISKKVLAEYQAVKGERESYEELISKFNKKINKTVGVRVLKDKAKLIA